MTETEWLACKEPDLSNQSTPFDNGTRSQLFAAGIDAILRF